LTFYHLWGYILLYKVEFFIRINGGCPIKVWLCGIGKKPEAILRTKLRMLEVEGLRLLNTNILKPIVGQTNLYEVRYSRYRIITFFDVRINVFILLNGFIKQRMNENKEIQRGVQLKEEYLLIS